MGGDRPHHQPTVYGALCRPGEQVHEEVIFFKGCSMEFQPKQQVCVRITNFCLLLSHCCCCCCFLWSEEVCWRLRVQWRSNTGERICWRPWEDLIQSMLVWLNSLVKAISFSTCTTMCIFFPFQLQYGLMLMTLLISLLFSSASPELSEKQCRELEAKLKAREEFLLPIYHQVAVQFVELHDTPGRMQEKGVITVSEPSINTLILVLSLLWLAEN